jgi:hypothetical protein
MTCLSMLQSMRHSRRQSLEKEGRRWKFARGVTLATSILALINRPWSTQLNHTLSSAFIYCQSNPFRITRKRSVVGSMQSGLLARAREITPEWIPKPSLSSSILLLIAAQVIYFVIKRYLEYRVREILAHY